MFLCCLVRYVNLTLDQIDSVTRPAKKTSIFAYILPLILVAVASYMFWDKRPQFVRTILESSQIFGALSSTSASATDSSSGVNASSLDSWEGTPNTNARRRKQKR